MKKLNRRAGVSADMPRRLDVATEVLAGFVAGLIMGFFILLFVSTFFPTLFSEGVLGTVFGVLGRLDPSATLLGKGLLVVAGVLGASYRYRVATRRSEDSAQAHDHGTDP
jgi:hypothetical protein